MKILLIEDEPRVADFIRRGLEEQDYDIEVQMSLNDLLNDRERYLDYTIRLIGSRKYKKIPPLLQNGLPALRMLYECLCIFAATLMSAKQLHLPVTLIIHLLDHLAFMDKTGFMLFLHNRTDIHIMRRTEILTLLTAHNLKIIEREAFPHTKPCIIGQKRTDPVVSVRIYWPMR